MARSYSEQIKLFIFPGLVSVLGFMIWSIVNEIRTDVKFLMAQSSSDHVRIDNLERTVYGKLSTSSTEIPPLSNKSNRTSDTQLVAIVPNNKNIVLKSSYKRKRT